MCCRVMADLLNGDFWFSIFLLRERSFFQGEDSSSTWPQFDIFPDCDHPTCYRHLTRKRSFVAATGLVLRNPHPCITKQKGEFMHRFVSKNLTCLQCLWLTQAGHAFPTAMDNRWRSSVDISQDIQQKRAIRLETLSAINHSVCSTIRFYH